MTAAADSATCCKPKDHHDGAARDALEQVLRKLCDADCTPRAQMWRRWYGHLEPSEPFSDRWQT